MAEKIDKEREEKIAKLNTKLLVLDSLRKDENVIFAEKVNDGNNKIRIIESLESEIQIEAKSLETKEAK